MEALSSNVLQYGAFGLCLILISYTAWKDKTYNKTINNHLNHVNQTIIELTKVIGSNNEIIKENTKVLDRVLNKLEK